ncbi:MAG: amidohydrolase family protein [Gemmatimonadales bacterium]
MIRDREIGAIAVGMVAGLLGCRPAPTPCPSCTVIDNVTLIDGTGRAPITGAAVLVEGDRIRAVGTRGQFRDVAQARTIDATGRFLIPGLIEMHGHVVPERMGGPPGVLDTAFAESMLRAFLTMGVTTVLSPGGDTELSIGLRDAVAAGRVAGPRLVVAGDVIESARSLYSTRVSATAAEVVAEVERQARAKVDFIKLYRSLDPSLIKAGADAAHGNGVRAIAHTSATDWLEAANAGVDLLVHAGPGISSLLTPAQRADYVRYGNAQPAAGGVLAKRFYGPFEAVDLDASRLALEALIAALKAHEVTVDPTVVIYEAVFWANDSSYLYHPDLPLVPESVVAAWRASGLTASWSPADFQTGRAVLPKMLRFIKALHDGGVMLVSGTDTPNPFVIPGASYHRNLELLAQAGIPPLEVLRIATLNGAKALRMDREVGSIEPGKRADMVLLTADPTADIGNTRRIEWVMTAGER